MVEYFRIPLLFFCEGYIRLKGHVKIKIQIWDAKHFKKSHIKHI